MAYETTTARPRGARPGWPRRWHFARVDGRQIRLHQVSIRGGALIGASASSRARPFPHHGDKLRQMLELSQKHEMAIGLHQRVRSSDAAHILSRVLLVLLAGIPQRLWLAGDIFQRNGRRDIIIIAVVALVISS